MSDRAYPVWLFVLAVLLAGPRVSSADPIVIYSNFGPPPGYVVEDWTPRPGYAPSFYSQSDTSLYSMGFELSESAFLTSVTVPVVFGGQLTSGISVWIFSGSAPQSGVLEAWRLDVPEGAQPRSASILTANSVIRPFLEANTQYFLAVYARAPGFDQINWPWNNAGIEGTVLAAGPAGDARPITGPLGAFQVTGEPAPVPEPATLLLVAAGGGAIVNRARRRRATP